VSAGAYAQRFFSCFKNRPPGCMAIGVLNRHTESSSHPHEAIIARTQPWRPFRRTPQPPVPSVLCEPLFLIDVLPAEDPDECPNHYEIVVPIPGIDHRNVYVFAGPQSIIVEILTKKAVQHPSGDVVQMERTDQRIRREFILRVPIEAGSTKVKFEGDSLRITAIKSTDDDQETWSEFIRFDL
jgi:HSP20 family molecular chaperone IbpA